MKYEMMRQFMASSTLAIALVTVLIPDTGNFNTELDSKVIFCNTAVSICGLLLILLLLMRNVYVTVQEVLLIILGLYVYLNFKQQVGGSNNLLLVFLSIIVVFTLIGNCISFALNSKHLYALCCIYFLTCISEISVGIVQLFFESGNIFKYVSGTLVNSGIFGQFAASVFAFSLAMFFCNNFSGKEQKIISALSALCCGLAVIIIPATHSRAGWVSSIVTSVVIIVYKNPKILTSVINRWPYLIVSLTTLMLLIALLYYYKKDSSNGRLVIWETSFQAVREKPLTGIGFGQVRNKFYGYQARYFQQHPEDSIKFTSKVNYLFSDPLQMTVENGICGTLILLSICISTILKAKAYGASMGPVFIPGLMGTLSIIISSFFSYPLQTAPILAVTLYYLTISGLFSHNRIRLHSYLSTLMLLLFAITLSYIFLKQRRVLSAKSSLAIARHELDMGNFKSALGHYALAKKALPDDKEILIGYGLCALKLENFPQSISAFSEANKYITDPFLSVNLGLAYAGVKKYQLAEMHINRSIMMMPNRLYFRLQLVRMYLSAKNLDKVITESNTILSMPVKVESSTTLEIKSEIREILSQIGKTE